MRQKVNFYQVDGIPMLAPDAEPEFSFADLDASDSGRDESGVMHRIMVREKVGTWSFSYAHLSDEELAYLRNLFAGKACGQGPVFLYPSCAGAEQRHRDLHRLHEPVQRIVEEPAHRSVAEFQVQHHPVLRRCPC